ncbi:hypothetical protein EZS27_009800, partial [termite gut metagenome]
GTNTVSQTIADITGVNSEKIQVRRTYNTFNAASSIALTASFTVTGGNANLANYNVTTAAGTGIITAKPITYSPGSVTKVYDYSNVVTIPVTNISGAVSGEVITITRTYATINVATSINLAHDFSVAGGQATKSNYSISTAAGTGAITAREVIVQGTVTKVYNNLNTVTGSQINLAYDKLTAETVTATATYPSLGVGTYTLNVVLGVTGGNALATNYVIKNTITGSITPLTLILTPSATITKVYDGTANVLQTFTCSNLPSGLNSVTYSAKYVYSNGSNYISVGEGIRVLPAIAGASIAQENFIITDTTGVITAKPLTNSHAISKTYDGTIILEVGDITLVGVVNSDNVTASGTYVDANKGTNKTVNYSLSGSMASNYSMASVATGVILAKTVQIEIITRVKAMVASDVVYSGFRVIGIVNIDALDITVTAATAVYTSGTDISVTFTMNNDTYSNYSISTTVIGNYAGDNSGNQLFDSAGQGHVLEGRWNQAGEFDVKINDAFVTIAGSITKIYDGTLVGRKIYSLGYAGALQQGEEIGNLTITAGAESELPFLYVVVTYRSTHVGSFNNTNLDFELQSTKNSLHNNYSLVTTSFTASITPRTVSVNLGEIRKVYDGTVAVEARDYTIGNISDPDLNLIDVLVTYDTPSSQSGIAIHFSLIDLQDGDDSFITDYVLPGALTAAGTIDRAKITVLNSAITKVYNKTNVLTVNSTSLDDGQALISLWEAESDNHNLYLDQNLIVTGLYSSVNIGFNIDINWTLSGADSLNYYIYNPITLGAITPREIGISIPTEVRKVYDTNKVVEYNIKDIDGTVTYVEAAESDYLVSNFISSDLATFDPVTHVYQYGLWVSAEYYSQFYSSIGINLTFKIENNTLSNYSLPNTSAISGWISKKSIIIPEIITKVYNGDLVALPAYDWTTKGLYPIDQSQVTISSIYGNKNVGQDLNVRFELTGFLSENYIMEYSNIPWGEITPATVNIILNANQSKTYGQTDSLNNYFTNLTPIISGELPKLNTENGGGLGRIKNDEFGGEYVGSYQITLGTLALIDSGSFLQANYVLGLVRGDYHFEITKATIDIIVTPQSKKEGGADPEFLFEYGSLQRGDVNPLFLGKLTREPGEAMGTYAYLLGDLRLSTNSGFSQNYQLELADNGGTVKFTIISSLTPIVQITVKAYSKNYGDVDPYFDFTVKIINGYGVVTPVFTGAISRTAAGTTSGENVGTYQFNAGTLRLVDSSNFIASDYQLETITNANSLTIEPAVITVIPNSYTKHLTEPDPLAISYTFSGNVRGEVPSFSGAIGRVAGSDIGSYPYIQSNFALLTQGSFNALNYRLFLDLTKSSFNIVADETIFLRVTPAANLSKVYGSADPDLSTKESFVINPVGGESVKINYKGGLGRQTGENVGTYAYTLGSIVLESDGIFDASNYVLVMSEENIKFEIKPKTLIVRPIAGQFRKQSASSDPEYTYEYSDNVRGDIPAFTGALSRVEGSDLGDYNYLKGSLTLITRGSFIASNYVLELVTIDGYGQSIRFSIIPDSIIIITIIPDANQSSQYGSSSGTGYLWHVDAATQKLMEENYIEITPGTFLGRQVGASVGSYSFNLGTLSLSGPGAAQAKIILDRTSKFNVVPAELYITAKNNQSKVYGDADPIYTFNIQGDLSGETPKFKGQLSRDAGENVIEAGYKIVQGTLVLDYNDSFYPSNYTIKYNTTPGNDVANVVNFNIVPRTLEVKPDISAAPVDKNSKPLPLVNQKVYGSYDERITYNTDTDANAVLLAPWNTATWVRDNGETVQEIAGFAGSLSREPGENVGTYAYKQNDLHLSDRESSIGGKYDFRASNYVLDFTRLSECAYTITPAKVVINWKDDKVRSLDPEDLTSKRGNVEGMIWYEVIGSEQVLGTEIAGFAGSFTLAQVEGGDGKSYAVGLGSLHLVDNPGTGENKDFLASNYELVYVERTVAYDMPAPQYVQYIAIGAAVGGTGLAVGAFFVFRKFKGLLG